MKELRLFRNIPFIVQIFVRYFVVPEFIPWYKDWMTTVAPVCAQFLTAFICMGFFTSPRVAEQVRAGISPTIPKGLSNASRVLGADLRLQGHSLAMRLIVSPLTSEAMHLVKNTAMALTTGLRELTMRANEMGENTFRFFAACIWAILIYILTALVVNGFTRYVEARNAVLSLILAK